MYIRLYLIILSVTLYCFCTFQSTTPLIKHPIYNNLRFSQQYTPPENFHPALFTLRTMPGTLNPEKILSYCNHLQELEQKLHAYREENGPPIAMLMDYDGTQIPKFDLPEVKVPENLQNQIYNFLKNGGIYVAITGRGPSNSDEIIEQLLDPLLAKGLSLNRNQFYIFDHGGGKGRVYNPSTGKLEVIKGYQAPIEDFELLQNELKRLVRKELENQDFQENFEDTLDPPLAIDKPALNPSYDDRGNEIYYKLIVADSFLRAKGFISKDEWKEKFERIAKQLKQKFPGLKISINSDATRKNINFCMNDKSDAVRWIIKNLKLKSQPIVAIGDGGNDINLIGPVIEEFGGIGVFVGEKKPEELGPGCIHAPSIGPEGTVWAISHLTILEESFLRKKLQEISLKPKEDILSSEVLKKLKSYAQAEAMIGDIMDQTHLLPQNLKPLVVQLNQGVPEEKIANDLSEDVKTELIKFVTMNQKYQKPNNNIENVLEQIGSEEKFSIVIYGNDDIQLIEKAAEIAKAYSKQLGNIIFTGGTGRLTEKLKLKAKKVLVGENLDSLSEAEIMAKLLISYGVNKNVILKHPYSTNTRENAENAYEILTYGTFLKTSDDCQETKGIFKPVKHVIGMQTPLQERRAIIAQMKVFEDYGVSNEYGLHSYIHTLPKSDERANIIAAIRELKRCFSKWGYQPRISKLEKKHWIRLIRQAIEIEHRDRKSPKAQLEWQFIKAQTDFIYQQ